MGRGKQEEVFNDWLGRFEALVARVARAHAATREDQDDLAQEILLQIWLSIPRFQGAVSATTWVYRVCLNTALSWKRGQYRRHKRLPLAGVDPAQLQAPEPSGIERRVLDHLYQAIRELPPADSAMILMHLDDLPTHQAAEILGMSHNHAAVRLHRAKKKLAQRLKGLGHEL